MEINTTVKIKSAVRASLVFAQDPKNPHSKYKNTADLKATAPVRDPKFTG